MTTTDHRLPRDVIPVDYEIDIDASPRRKLFRGHLALTLRVLHRVDSFELNARGLEISHVEAIANKKRLPGKVELRPERETVALSFGESLPKGRVIVTMSFRGKLNPNMHGLYLAADGSEKAIVSQCEATDARAIFPCFDEPDLKATIKWLVRTDPGYAVITNGVPDRMHKTRRPVRAVHTFKRTRVIPTYLAALTIGKYDQTDAQRISRIPTRVVTGVGRSDQTDLAQAVTAFVLPWYEEYFGHRYNYQKLDQVAVPGFDAGAMENVGAIFYRQSLLLMRAGTASWSAQKRIAEVIAHELAHQWFGNLVTMKWWDDLWLNEAFATWIAYEVVDAWKPDWRMWDDYLESKEHALAADALVNTHPIYTKVATPAEATELFDVITYEKGCAVLRMAESFLGADTFRAGIRDYIATYKNGNATGADLWDCLGRASDAPVAGLMESWITQGGFPLVSVTTREVAGRTELHLRQRRFFANANEMKARHDQLWEIPLVIDYDAGEGRQSHRVVMGGREQIVTLPARSPARWVYPNSGSTGFFRMHLDDRTLGGLLEHGLTALTPAERRSLIEDRWALVKSGLCDIGSFLGLLVAFRDDDDYVVTRTVVGRLGFIGRRLVRDEDRPALAELVRWMFKDQLVQLGWNPAQDEEPPQAVRRAALVSALGDLGRDKAVLAEAVVRVEREMEDPSAAEPNLAGTLVSLSAMTGDRVRLQRFVNVYRRRKKSGASPQLQARYLDALAYFEAPELVAAVHRYCLDGTVPQDQLRLVLISQLGRRASQRATWKFIKKNWSEIGPKSGAMGIARLVESTGVLPVDLRDDVEKFFTDNPVEEAARALKKALEALDLRRDLGEREAEGLGNWLRHGPQRLGKSA